MLLKRCFFVLVLLTAITSCCLVSYLVRKLLQVPAMPAAKRQLVVTAVSELLESENVSEPRPTISSAVPKLLESENISESRPANSSDVPRLLESKNISESRPVNVPRARARARAESKNIAESRPVNSSDVPKLLEIKNISKSKPTYSSELLESKRFSEPRPTNSSHVISATHKKPTKIFEPMALSLDYWEQTSNALMNLFDLQCWASTVNISGVVEPSIKHGKVCGVFSTLAGPTPYTFRYLFDLDHWNNMSLKYRVSPLVSLEKFLQNASRDVVYVQISYYQLDKEHCYPLSTVAKAKWAKFLKRKGFHLVETMCFNLLKEPAIKEQEFIEKIFEGDNRQRTVIFERFKGISPWSKGCRLTLTGPRSTACSRKLSNIHLTTKPTTVLKYIPLNSTSQIVPSKRIVEYTNRFISEHLSGEKYIAVMMRTEKLKTILVSENDSDTCASNIILDWKELVTRSNVTKTLLFTDTGSQGSLTLAKNQAAINYSNYISDAFKVDFNLEQINSIIKKMVGSDDYLQIAALHRQLAVHATCVLMVGGGGYQAHTLNMYFYKNRGLECFKFRDGSCNSLYVDKIYGIP